MLFNSSLSSSPQVKPSILLFLLIYLICVIQGASELQGSGVGLLLFVVTLRFYRNDYNVLWLKTWKAWALFAAVMLLGVFHSELIEKSLKGGYNIIRASLLFFVAATVVMNTVKEKDSLATVRKAFVAYTFLMLISYIVLILLQGELGLRYNKYLISYLSGIHEYANIISIILLGFISLWVVDKQSFSALHYLCCVALVVILLASNSKGAYLALIVCLLYVFWRYVPLMKLPWLILTTAMLSFYGYIFYIHTGSELFGYDIPLSLLERRRLLEGTIEAISSQPWFGYGLNTYKYIIDGLGWNEMFAMPHNIFVELIFSIGVVGTAIVLGALSVFYYKEKSSDNSYTQTEEFWILLANLLLIYVVFRGLTELKLGFKVWGLVAIAYGLMIAVNLIANNKNRVAE